MIGLVQVGDQAMADRYAYIPFIGLFLMIVWRIADGVADWNARPTHVRKIPTRWLAIPAVCYLLLLGTLTYAKCATGTIQNRSGAAHWPSPRITTLHTTPWEPCCTPG